MSAAPPKVTVTFTAADGAKRRRMTIETKLERTNLGNIGGGHVIILDDLTVIPVACGGYWEDPEHPGDPDWHRLGPPNGDWSIPIIIEDVDGTQHRMPYDTEVWKLK